MKKWVGFSFPVILLAGTLGCNQGPAERAGEQVDRSVDKAGDNLERAGDRVRDRVDR